MRWLARGEYPKNRESKGKEHAGTVWGLSWRVQDDMACWTPGL